MAGHIERLLNELTEAGVQYVVVGGVAVVLHGYLRATADLDLIIGLDRPNVEAALSTFETMGFHPRAPVGLREFADPAMRKQWLEEKNLQVFSLWHSEMPGFEVDIFVESPLPFPEAYRRAIWAQLGNQRVPVASIDDLIAMKRAAGRPRDQEDIEALLELKKANERPSR